MAVSPNFAFLVAHDAQLAEIATEAEEQYFKYPVTCLMKLRQFGELLARLVAANVCLYINPDEKQLDLLNRLESQNLLPGYVNNLFHQLRKNGNDANHHFRGNHDLALTHLIYARELGIWFHRTYGDSDEMFIPGEFITPADLERDKEAFFPKKIDTLRNVIEDLISLKIKKNSLPMQTREEKHKIVEELDKMKHYAQYRQTQLSQSRNLTIKQLQKKQDKITLELIKIEIEISDIEGFNNNYINSLLSARHKEKESLELKLMKIEEEKKQLAIQSDFYTSEQKKLKIQLIQRFKDLDNQCSKELARITSQIEENKVSAKQLIKELASFNVMIPNDLILELYKHSII